MIVIGYDVGQASDPSALVGLRFDGRVWAVVDTRTMPLGMTYVDQIAEVCGHAARFRERGETVAVAVDETGVGRPIAADLIAALPTAVGVTITAGKRPSGTWPRWRVPKPLLVHAVAAGLRSGALALPPRGHAQGLKNELVALARKPSGRIEARGSGHDDQALALMLAYWTALVTADPATWTRWESTKSGVVVRG